MGVCGPQQYWSAPPFKQVNRTLTLLWGLAFALCALLGVVAQHDRGGSAWLNWTLPIVILIGAFKFTAWYPDHVKAREGVSGVAAA